MIKNADEFFSINLKTKHDTNNRKTPVKLEEKTPEKQNKTKTKRN